MNVYIVEYSTETNKCLQMEIEAPNLETVYEIVNEHYADLCIDSVYPAEEEYDGQPSEHDEWMSFDPDC